MVQFYFLSIMLNIIVGVILFSSANNNDYDDDDIEETRPAKRGSKAVKEAIKNDSIFTNETFCLICGIVCVLVAVFKLFLVYHHSAKDCHIPVIGDLLPAVIGIFGGATVVLNYHSKSFADHDLPEFIDTNLFRNKKYIGCACIVIAVIHFIVPGLAIL